MKKEIKDYMAEMLRKLTLYHKKQCKEEDCGISTLQIYEFFYKPFLGKEKAEKHFEDFI